MSARTGIMVRCKQCHGTGILHRGRGREVIQCSCLAGTTDPAREALKAKLLAAFREELAKDAKK